MDKNQLDDEAIGVVVDSKIRDAVSWYQSKLSTEREKVTRYYNGELPRRQSEGNSSYISTDVYDSVEAMKAQLLETFAAGYDIVKFEPQGPEDVEPCRIATEYTQYVIFRQNDGYAIFNDVTHDGLSARVGVAKVYWDKSVITEDHEFEGLQQQEVDGLTANEHVTDLEANLGEDGMYSGTMTKKTDHGKVTIEAVNPEEFFIEEQAKALTEDYFCGQRFVKTVADLVAMGYSKSKLLKYNPESDDTLNQLPEVLARFQAVSNGAKRGETEAQDELRLVLINEVYIKLVPKGGDTAKLFKIVRCGNTTLAMDEVDRIPFKAFVPLPIPHSFYGNNFAARVMPAQNVRTVLTRQIVDHATVTNNPRYQVLKGGLTNPRELLDNRLGGIVNVTRPDAVLPLPQTSLNPFVYQTLEMIKTNNDETTGISSLSQGLNKDAVSKQNSQGMINDLVSLSQTRQKIIARNFANGFLIPLFIEVYRLVLENESKESIVELSGNWVEINPKTWAERKDATVSLTLGYGEQEKQAQKYIQLIALAAQHPFLSRSMGDNGAYNAAMTSLKLQGIKNVNDYFQPVEKTPPAQPDPTVALEQQKLQLEAQKIAADVEKAKAQAQIAQVNASVEMARMQHEAATIGFEQQIKLREQDRKDLESANKIDISQREMTQVENAPPEAQTNIASPNS